MIGQSLQVRGQPQQTRTRLKDDPAWVAWVRSVVRVQNLQSVEAPQSLQLQEVIVGHVLVPETATAGYHGNHHDTYNRDTACDVSGSPYPQRFQMREQLWEESDEVGRRAPGLQVKMLKLRCPGGDHLQVVGLQVHTQRQAEQRGGQEVSVRCQGVASY